MKKIITAINCPELNEKLKKEKNLEIIGKDVQYREALIEILKKRKDIDIIILYEKILGKISIEELISKIKKINSNIDIIFFLEKEDKEKRKILNNKNVKKIYLKKEINSKNIIKFINNKKIIKEKEISTKVITLIGENIIIDLIKILKNKKILIINFDRINKEIFNIFNLQKDLNKIKNKKINKLGYKINENIVYIFKLNNLLKNKSLKDRKEFINDLFKNNYKKYDYIFIEDCQIYSREIKKIILSKSDRIIWNMQKSYIGTKELREIKKNFCDDVALSKKDIFIINEFDKFHSVSFYIIKEIFKNQKNIYFINFKNKFQIEYKIKKLIKRKNMENYKNKIIKNKLIDKKIIK